MVHVLSSSPPMNCFSRSVPWPAQAGVLSLPALKLFSDLCNVSWWSQMLSLTSPFVITPNTEIMFFCSPPCSRIFVEERDVTGKRVLENSLLTVPVPDLLWQRREGLCKYFHRP